MLELPDGIQPRTVVGVLLNYRQAYEALAGAMSEAPYKAPPVAPVLYIKPANTYAADGQAITLPSDVAEVEVGACLGVVIGRRATRVARASAMDYVSGYRVVADLSVPHTNYYRPALKQRCRDGFCPMSAIAPAGRVHDPDRLDITVSIDGTTVLQANTGDLIRPVASLIEDITAFMTLEAGDLLLVGVPAGSPHARAGQQYEIAIPGVGTLTNRLLFP